MKKMKILATALSSLAMSASPSLLLALTKPKSAVLEVCRLQKLHY